MSIYRVTRKLAVTSVFESYVGVYQQANLALPPQPVLLRRLLAPWSHDAGFIERFEPLAGHWRAIAPEVACSLMEFGTGADSMWVTQSLTDGESVRSLLTTLSARQMRPQMNEVVALGIRAASALAAIHEQSVNLQHGDVCSSTVHLTTTGQVLFTDLGIATAAGFSPATGPARCEMASLAPEQHAGTSFTSTDVYRLGLVLLELVTGRATAGSTWPGVPEKLATALSWMLANDPTQRPQARDVESALHSAAEQSDWSVTDADLVRFLARLMPQRTPLTAIPPIGGTPLSLSPVTPAPTPANQARALPVPGVTLARISTRKVSAELLAVEREKAAAEAAAKMPPSRDVRVAEVLVAQQRLSLEQVAQACAYAEGNGLSVTDAIIALNLCDEDVAIGAEGEVTKTTVITAKNLLESRPAPELLWRLSADDAEAIGAIPLSVKSGDQLVLAMRDPLNTEALDALKRLSKASAVFGVRAGPRALARAVGTFYRGVDTEDPASWLQTAGDMQLDPPPAGFTSANSGLVFESTPSSFMPMEIESRGTLATPTKANATLDDPQAALLDAALALLGDRGRAASQFVALAGALTRRIGASEADIARVRFSAAAIALTNVSAGRAPWEPLNPETVSSVCGSGWRAACELISRGLDVSKGPANDAAMVSLQTALFFCASGASVRPSGPTLATALGALRARQFPKVMLDAIEREMS